MPTLFRMFFMVAILGIGFIGFLAYLGSSSEPAGEMVTIDVPAGQIGKGTGRQNGTR